MLVGWQKGQAGDLGASTLTRGSRSGMRLLASMVVLTDAQEFHVDLLGESFDGEGLSTLDGGMLCSPANVLLDRGKASSP